MSKYQKHRDKRNRIIVVLAAAILALCLISSLQEKYTADLGLPKLSADISTWLAERNINVEWLLGAGTDSDTEIGELRVHFIDVGQGKSILIQAPESNVLIDTGESGHTDTLLSYLDHLKLSGIDILIATHPHADHIGGMDRVVRQYRVGDIIMPDLPDALIPTTRTFTGLLEAIEEKDLSITSAHPGKSYDLGNGATLQILAPVDTYDDLNNISMTARLSYHQVSFLFTGDIEALAEKDILASGRELSSNVLDVAHHGSNTSSTREFVEAVEPEIAVFSCGIDNSYGHPHREPIELMEQQDVQIYRTDLDGTVVISTDGQELSVRISQ